jgi:hypothetical protein
MAHMLISIPRDAGHALVHAHDRRIDHLHCGNMSGGKRIHDLVPNTSPPPSNETIVASRRRAILPQITPRRT